MIVVFRVIRAWWYARMRRIDMEILWPTCLEQTHSLDHAKAAFAYHAFHDPAWLELGEDAIIEFIDGLGTTNLPVADRRTIYSESNDPRLEPDYQPPARVPRAPKLHSPHRKQGPSGLRRPPD